MTTAKERGPRRNIFSREGARINANRPETNRDSPKYVAISSFAFIRAIRGHLVSNLSRSLAGGQMSGRNEKRPGRPFRPSEAFGFF
jgi:hypothetical protein